MRIQENQTEILALVFAIQSNLEFRLLKEIRLIWEFSS